MHAQLFSCVYVVKSHGHVSRQNLYFAFGSLCFGMFSMLCFILRDLFRYQFSFNFLS